ncbi:MAG TPA: DnaJ family molecular chaperone [Rhizomicrobium sp.]|nr:DnaJ family molecular chaperone [Rhizomicrobium sp.]
MSIWGKFSGAVSGLIASGGALLSAVAEHLLGDREADASITFTIAMIALSAKMAKADGIVTGDEVQAFERLFRVTPDEAANVRRVFDMAQRDTAGYETYAGQVARLFAGNPAVLEDILDGLFEIAKADGVLHPGEAVFLERVGEIFGFAPNEFRRIRASHFAPDKADPYVVLGVAYDASEDEIKHAYRRLVRDNHPDSLIGRGVPEEFVRLANDKLAAINGAYAKVVVERGFR